MTSFSAFGDYKRAKALYAKKQYEAAANEYYIAFSKAKKKVDKRRAEWGLAQSLQKIGLLYSSSKYYSVIVRRGRKASNPFFRSALEELGNINSKLSLGRSHIVKLFKTKLRLSDVPGPSRGFYFYYKGIEVFDDRRLEKAKDFFSKVPSSSDYYLGALFHLGVISNLSGRHSRAISYFEKVLAGSRGKDELSEIREMSLMNIARVHYEQKRYTQAISYYGQIARSSENWLEALWESSWAFFFMEKFNNTLGNIHTLHSPFFENRFYPESYILRAITFLRLCRFDSVKGSMKQFRDRYASVFGDVKGMLSRYKGDPKGFFKLVYDYKRGQMTRFKNAEQIVKKLSSIDAYKGARDTIRFADRELDLLKRFRNWSNSGLLSSLASFLNSKKRAAISSAGRLMYKEGTSYYTQLLELSNQTKLIVAEMQLGKLAKLRSLIKVDRGTQKTQFIGGLQKLNINETLEYWPFEGEYWEDELGFYVYNLESLCKKSRN
ncbi:MAG: tetratricopeptide repeat protein [Pseudobacteriovorax sp.]|nr:tetratricopeptide repeat protein [Pseudobacteriovorax sp.]